MSKAKKFVVGDQIQHDFSGQKGEVLYVRTEAPYTILVLWETGLTDWYKPEVLEEAINA